MKTPQEEANYRVRRLIEYIANMRQKLGYPFFLEAQHYADVLNAAGFSSLVGLRTHWTADQVQPILDSIPYLAQKQE